jgi:hypothetical protein
MRQSLVLPLFFLIASIAHSQTVTVVRAPTGSWYTATLPGDLTSTAPGSDFADPLFERPSTFGNSFRIRVRTPLATSPFYLYAQRTYSNPWDGDVWLYLYDDFDNPTVPTLITNTPTLIASRTTGSTNNIVIRLRAYVTDLDAADVTALTFSTNVTYTVRLTPLP